MTKYRPPCGDAPCAQCPFRRTSLGGWLGAAAPERFVNSILAEIPLPCHPTIDYDDPAWAEKWVAQEAGNACAGALILAANIGKKPRDPAAPRLRADKATVFATHQEFIAHHRESDRGSWIGFDDDFEATPGKVGDRG